MNLNIMEKGATTGGNEEEFDAADCLEEAVDTARAERNSARAEMAEDKAVSTQSMEVSGVRENEGEDLQPGSDDDGNTQPEKKRKRRKRRKKKTRHKDSRTSESADSICDAKGRDCDGSILTGSTGGLNDCAEENTNQVPIEGNNSRTARRRRRRRKKNSQLSGGDCETLQVQESVADENNFCLGLLVNCDGDKEKARGNDSATATSKVCSCDVIIRDCDGSTLGDSTGGLEDCAEKAQSCTGSHSKKGTNQGQKEGKKSRGSMRRKGENSQSRQAIAEESNHLQGDMASGNNINASPSIDDKKEEQRKLGTAENVHVSSTEKKRNRRRKGNRFRDDTGLEGRGEANGESFSCAAGSARRPNENKGIESGGRRHTPSTSRATPKSHDISARKESHHGTSRNRGNQRRDPYEKYWSSENVSTGLKREELVKGVLRISPRNYELAWVTVPGLKRDVLLEGMLKRNRALNGDVVALQILPKDKWKVMSEELDYNGITPDLKHKNVEDTTKRLQALTLNPGSDLQSPISASSQYSPGSTHKDHPIDFNQVPEQFLQRTAKVVYILEKKHTRVASGHLKPFPHPKEFPDACFSPSDSRLPRIRIRREDCPVGFFERPRDFQNTLLVARIVSWPETSSRDSFLAIGKIARSLGEGGKIEPETEGILLEYGIDSGPFSDEVLACLPEETPWKIPEEELKYRRDFREDCVFTIDPLTARDLDDAVHCKKIKDGVFEIGVHIADVSYFVRQGTALDEAALEMGTSTYMVQKIVPMLPRRLCEELCSLNPGEDRLTFSVVWQMTDKGEILDDWKGRGIIRSRIKLAYEHAQNMIEKPNRRWNPNELPPLFDGATVKEISAQVNQLHEFAVRLRRNRFENGALRLDQVKIWFDLDQETGLPNGYNVYEQRDANRLIQEFMLLANIAVAHHIYNSYPEKALLRRHPKPHQKQLEDLIEMCQSFGISFKATSSKSIQESLAQFPLSSPEREVLVNLTMRPMKNAEYFCTGSVEEDQYGHYALCVPLYTHFTSPIRRYPDLVVHRLLAASLGIDEPINQKPETIDMIAEHCNDRKLAAKRASELSDEMFFGIFVRESGPLEEDGIVLNVMDQSLDILVPKLGVVKRAYLKFCPGVKGFEFTKGEKGKPAELSLRWSVKLKPGDTTYEEEQVIKIFNQVRVILTTESETETRSTNPFKVMAKIVPRLNCECEYYIPSSPANEKSVKKKKAAGNSPEAELPNPSYEIRKKLFDSEQDPNDARTSEAVFRFKETNCVKPEHKTEGTALNDSDDVIVESEENTDSSNENESTTTVENGYQVLALQKKSALSSAINEATTAANEESDDVIVESDSEAEQS